jgi:hypothetical protein
MRRIPLILLALVGWLGSMVGVASAKPALEPMYANDTIVYMSAPQHAVAAGAAQTEQDFYLIAYPIVPAGVHPLCNFSCPGPSDVPQVRDVVLNGSPGFGTQGTAGSFNPNWHVFVAVYSPQWLLNPDFQPVRSAAELDAGEAAGHFLPINRVGDNPFEVDTGVTFLCVLVSSNA